MLPLMVGMAPFGMVCGVAAEAQHVSIWGALGLSAFVFSGIAQIVALQLLASGAPVAVIVLSCFILGLRLIMYSAAMAPYLKPVPGPWRNALAFLLTDQAFAMSMRRFRQVDEPRGGASYFLGGGLALWTMWQAANLFGYWVGNVVPPAWGLDFIVPLCFLSVLVPALEDGPTRVAAVASGVAVIALEAMPMRLALISAGAIGITLGLVTESLRGRARRRSGGEG